MQYVVHASHQVSSSTAIKEAAYGWVKQLQHEHEREYSKQPKSALAPAPAPAPVISCWAERNNTFSEVLDVHLYNSDFEAWNEQVFAECIPSVSASVSATVACDRGAVVTEAGARWYQGFGADAGSPLTVLHWLTALRESGREQASSNYHYPFVPGVFVSDPHECL